MVSAFELTDHDLVLVLSGVVIIALLAAVQILRRQRP